MSSWISSWNSKNNSHTDNRNECMERKVLTDVSTPAPAENRPKKGRQGNRFRTVMILLLCTVLACSSGTAAALTAGQPVPVQAIAFSGWKKISGNWFYYTSGKVRTGWVKIDGRTYYVDAITGRKSGFATIDGRKYYFDSSGAMTTGWQTINGYKYYMGGNGQIRKGFQTIGGKKYYFWPSTSNGHYSCTMATKFFTVDGKGYYAGGNGQIRTGWQTINGYKYYMGGNGQIRKGFQTIGGKIYYFWPGTEKGHYSCTMATKFFTVSGQTYYAGGNGQVRTGWQTINGYKYHMSSTGAMQTGWQTINKKKYYFYQSNSEGHYRGTMASGCYVGGKYLDVRGVYRSNVSEKAVVSKAADWKLESGKATTKMIMHFRKGDLVSMQKGYELILWDINTEKPLCTYSAGMVIPKSMYALVTVRKANKKNLTSAELKTVASLVKVAPKSSLGYSKALSTFRKNTRFHEASGYYEVAHRGASQYAPQNTLASFKLASQLGFDAVETDIRFTKDNVPVILHDETINSTSNGRGRIADMTLAQARKYNFGNSAYGKQKIPTLKETVRTCKENGLTEYLEIKPHLTEAQAKNIVSIVRSGGMSSDTVWLVWENSTSNLEKMNRLADKSSAIGILSEGMTTKTISLASSLKKKSGRELWICSFVDAITKSLITKAHKAGIKVNAWTLSDSSQAAKLYGWGIDSITTNGCVNVKNYLESQTKAAATKTYASAGPSDAEESDNAQAAGADLEESLPDAQEDDAPQEDAAQEIDGQESEEAGEDVCAEDTADQDAAALSEESDTVKENSEEITEVPAEDTDEITEAPAETTDKIAEVPAETTDKIAEAPAETTDKIAEVPVEAADKIAEDTDQAAAAEDTAFTAE